MTNLNFFFLFSPYFKKIGTPWLREAFLRWVPWPDVRQLKIVTDIMDRTSIDIFEKKRAALKRGDEAVLQQLGKGKDIMALLRKSKSVFIFL